MLQEQGPDGGLSSCSLRALFFANYVKRPNCPEIDTVSLIHFSLNRWSREKYLVRRPESDPPPPPNRGFLQTCIISKLQPRVFEKCMFALDLVVGVAVQQHTFPQQRVTGYPHQEVS